MKFLSSTGLLLLLWSNSSPVFTAVQPSLSLEAFRTQLVQLVQEVQSSVLPLHAEFDLGRTQPIDYTNFGYAVLLQPDVAVAPADIVDGSRKIWIAHPNDEALACHISGWDAEHDLAVLTLERPLNRAAAEIEASQPAAGEPVLILTNSLSAVPAVSFGALSCVRNDGILQISGNLPMGSEGGAVFNFKGQLIGLVYAKMNPAIDPINPAAALLNETVLVHPIQEIRNAVADVLQNAARPKVYMGVSVVDWPSQLGGAHIQQVMAGSPAAQSGLQVGDIILSANNHKVSTAKELFNNVRDCQAGSRLDLRILRGHQILAVPVQLDSLPIDTSSPSATVFPLETNAAAESIDREFIEWRIKTLEMEILRLRRLLK